MYWWAAMTNRTLIPEEVEALMAVDDAYLSQVAKEAADKRERDKERQGADKGRREKQSPRKRGRR